MDTIDKTIKIFYNNFNLNQYRISEKRANKILVHSTSFFL